MTGLAIASIVNLAGHDCVGIVSYENHKQGRSSVICEDRSVYRIQVTPESRVKVEKQSPDRVSEQYL